MGKSWKQWVALNLERGCNPVEIRDILLKNSFSMEAARQLMGPQFPDDPSISSAGDSHYIMPEDMYKALSECRITKPAIPDIHGPCPIQRIDTDLLQLYILEKFITDKECEKLDAIARRQLRPSTTTTNERYYRTSSTCDLHHIDDPLVKTIDLRIATALGINLSYTEEIQAQLYLPKQEFKKHTDFFTPNTEDYKKHASIRGNRTWTFMVYLKSATKGGGTEFTELGQTFTPARGTAIIWNNLDAQGVMNHGTMHAGLPVEEGEKMVITKWFRERGNGLMFMDPIIT